MQTLSVTESRVNQLAKFLSRLDRHKPKTEFCVDVFNYIKTILNELGTEEVTDRMEIIAGLRETFPSPRIILPEIYSGPRCSPLRL